MSLVRKVGEIWKGTPALCALVGFHSVYTGRAPDTKAMYEFPYVCIHTTQGHQVGRTDKTMLSSQFVTFHVWCDDSKLEFGETVAAAIADVYANRMFPIDSKSRVFDVLDEGEPLAHQTDLPNVKAWEVVKMFSFRIERDRVEHDDPCGEGSGSASMSPITSSSGSDVASAESSSSASRVALT